MNAKLRVNVKLYRNTLKYVVENNINYKNEEKQFNSLKLNHSQ